MCPPRPLRGTQLKPAEENAAELTSFSVYCEVRTVLRRFEKKRAVVAPHPRFVVPSVPCPPLT